MAKAIDNIKAWAKENVQLITILPENENLQVDTRLKDVLETSVDEKYYLSDEKTALLIAQLEEKDKVAGTIGHHPFSKKFEFSGYNSEISPTLLATDYKAPKTVLENATTPVIAGSLEHYGNDQMNRVYHTHGISPTITVVSGGGREQKIAEKVEMQQYSNGEGISYNLDANYAKGTSVGDVGKGRRTQIVEGIAPSYRIRKLTPLECFRLQSFPDWAFHEATEVNSNSQLYKQAGNSVTVNVIHEIAKRLN